jgi:hypothetical protein
VTLAKQHVHGTPTNDKKATRRKDGSMTRQSRIKQKKSMRQEGYHKEQQRDYHEYNAIHSVDCRFGNKFFCFHSSNRFDEASNIKPTKSCHVKL